MIFFARLVFLVFSAGHAGKRKGGIEPYRPGVRCPVKLILRVTLRHLLTPSPVPPCSGVSVLASSVAECCTPVTISRLCLECGAMFC